jgi:hypothetical protein
MGRRFRGLLLGSSGPRPAPRKVWGKFGALVARETTDVAWCTVRATGPEEIRDFVTRCRVVPRGARIGSDFVNLRSPVQIRELAPALFSPK